MASESDLKTKAVKECRGFGYARRIEDKYGVGIPDMFVALDGHPTCLIEAKIIDGASFHPSLRQHIELERWAQSDLDGRDHWRLAKTRRSLMLGFKNGLYYLHNYAEVVKVKDCEVSDPGEIFPLFLKRFLR